MSKPKICKKCSGFDLKDVADSVALDLDQACLCFDREDILDMSDSEEDEEEVY